MTIHRAEPAAAFWYWAKCLGELLFWAKNPAPSITSQAGWLEAFREDLQRKGDRARDAAADATTRNQVTRSRSLALEVVRLLNENPELNDTPCRDWSHSDRQTVDQLVDLQSRFATLGDGPAVNQHGNEPSVIPAREDGWPTLSPAELRKLFDIEQDALVRRLNSQAIRNAKITSKSYRIDPGSLPDGWERIIKRD